MPWCSEIELQTLMIKNINDKCFGNFDNGRARRCLMLSSFLFVYFLQQAMLEILKQVRHGVYVIYTTEIGDL